MPFLLVYATVFEAQPMAERFKVSIHGEDGLFISPDKSIEILITGVGMVNTAYWMGRVSEREYSLMLNLGICGAFNRSLNIGEAVNIVSDSISEMGAQNDSEFLPYKEMQLPGSNIYQGNDIHKYLPLKNVSSITVNTVHGNEEAIARANKRFNADVESMEGAAFMRACTGKENYFQLRAVSNYVEKRDRSKWNIPLAIANVNEAALPLLHKFKI